MAQDDPEGFSGKVEDSARAVALLKSLSHEGRLQILCILIDHELSVTEIAVALDTSPSSVSQQMMRLRAEGAGANHAARQKRDLSAGARRTGTDSTDIARHVLQTAGRRRSWSLGSGLVFAS